MIDWDALETSLDEVPEFPVEAPPARRTGSELSRQVQFRNLMRMAAPRVLVEANPNAGKRNPLQARREGIVAGVFDLDITFRAPLVAHIEFKGFTAKGRPGVLSPEQVAWGNRRQQLGYPVACFFTPDAAVDWLRSLGFPIARVTK